MENLHGDVCGMTVDSWKERLFKAMPMKTFGIWMKKVYFGATVGLGRRASSAGRKEK